MPRLRRFTPSRLMEGALPLFWSSGFAGASMDDLVRATGGSRQAVYGAFRDKHALLLAAIDAYRAQVVDPAFAPVERPGAGLAEIAGYFERQIAAAEAAGLPGPGCLLANLMTETAPHDPAVRAQVEAHLDRLRAGFANALRGAARSDGTADLDGLADLLTVAAQGLWSVSRVARGADALRRPVAALLSLVEAAVAR